MTEAIDVWFEDCSFSTSFWGSKKKRQLSKTPRGEFTDFIRFLSEVVQKKGNHSLSEQAISVLIFAWTSRNHDWWWS